MLKPLIAAASALLPGVVWASEGHLDMTTSLIGMTCVAVFVLAYAMVMVEEFTHLRKSKPVIVGAGIIWALVAVAAFFIAAGLYRPHLSHVPVEVGRYHRSHRVMPVRKVGQLDGWRVNY